MLEPGENPVAAVRRIRGGIVAYSAARSDDPHYEDRLRRAACHHALAGLTGARGLHTLAHRLARAENGRRAWLPPLHVFDRVGPIIERQPDPIGHLALIADLQADLVLLAGVPYLRDNELVDGTT